MARLRDSRSCIFPSPVVGNRPRGGEWSGWSEDSEEGLGLGFGFRWDDGFAVWAVKRTMDSVRRRIPRQVALPITDGAHFSALTRLLEGKLCRRFPVKESPNLNAAHRDAESVRNSSAELNLVAKK